MIAPRTKGRVYLQSFMDALITFSTFWVFLFVFVLVQQTDSRSQLEAIGAATERGLDPSLYGEAGLRSGHEAQHAGWIRRWRGV